MLRGQKEYLELEVRKFRRKKLMTYHQLEQELLRQELNKRQNQLEQAHSMLLRHHEKTQELEYRQQKTVHALREEQVRFRSHINGFSFRVILLKVKNQHDTELTNQAEYMKRTEREMRKKHALELKQQPKSLKVSASRT